MGGRDINFLILSLLFWSFYLLLSVDYLTGIFKQALERNVQQVFINAEKEMLFSKYN